MRERRSCATFLLAGQAGAGRCAGQVDPGPGASNELGESCLARLARPYAKMTSRATEWRHANPDKVVAENARRRAAYRDVHPLSERRCVVCGKPMTKRPDAIVCSEPCRRERKRQADRARRRARVRERLAQEARK